MPPSFATLLVGLPAARAARRLTSLQSLLGQVGSGPRRAAEARRESLGGFLRDLAARRAVRAPEPREGVPEVLAILGMDTRGDAHAALLAWALDRDAEHGLGDRFADALCTALAVDRASTRGPLRVRRDGATVYLEGASGRLGFTLQRAPRAVRPARRSLRPGAPGSVRPGPMPWDGDGHGADGTGRRPGSVVRALGYDVLLGVLATVSAGAPADGARADGAVLLAAWARTIARVMLGRTTMTDWKGFSPDVRFLLEHWQEYLDVVAVREQVDREFTQVRHRVLDAVRARYPDSAGWDATVDEDWVLLRRKDWPIPAEEWLAFVVVISDVESVMTDGREGWWSAVSLPTDGDFDGDTFTTMVRAKLDAAAWRAHLPQRWPGHALGRNLPRLDGRAVLSGGIETAALDELARYVQLVPAIDQALRDMG